MKSILISIQPKWCELIASGKKTVEVRKTVPKLETPFKCYIYCTNTKPYLVWGDVFRGGSFENEFTHLSGYNRKAAEEIWDLFNGKVMGEFTCDNIFEIVECFDIHHELPGSPVEKWLTWDDAPDEYDSQEDIEKATCLSMDEITAYMGASGGLFCWHISDLVIYDAPKPLSDFTIDCNSKGGCDIPYLYAPPCENCGKNKLTRPPQSWCYVEEFK